MKKFVIFDLDGTLLNTLDDLAAAANHALEVMSLPIHPVEAFRMFVGNGVPKLVERMTPEALRHDAALSARLRQAFDEYYGPHGQDLTRPYDGVILLLDELLNRGMKLAILSNKPHEFVKTLVPHYFGERFTVVYGQRAGYPTKPDGSLVEEVLADLGGRAEEAVYLGDSGVDMETARNGGVFSVGVLWGFRSREELLAHGAQALIERPEELLPLLTGTTQ